MLTSIKNKVFINAYIVVRKTGVIPGNEVLAFGQRYLTQEETAKILGANVSRRLQFEGATPDLTGAQKELVYYIANKVSDSREINVQLSVTEENLPGLTEQRLQGISEQFRIAGLDNIRIQITNSDRLKRKSDLRTTIEISLFQ